MINLFKELQIDQSLIIALEKEGIKTPTEVQKRVLPEAIKNKDLVVESETGTGKTLAYLLPIFQKIDLSKREMQVIILAPTHELVIQILRQIESLSENSETKATSTSALGNVNIQRQIEKLREKPQIIVGSPGRVLELIKKKKITAHTIKTIVIDEADRLMDQNNLQSIKEIIKSTPRERQLMMFSASITKDAEAKAREFMNEPVYIRARAEAAVPPTIENIYFQMELRDKMENLRKIIRSVNPKKAIVFIGEREEADVCANKLCFHGLKAEAMHGQNAKLDRKKVMSDFKSGKIQVLVASDIAARGLHIEGVTHIFNLNIPQSSQDYLHRVGRTGRKGNKGMAISLVTEKELENIKKYEKELKIEILPKEMYKGKIVDVKKNK